MKYFDHFVICRCYVQGRLCQCTINSNSGPLLLLMGIYPHVTDTVYSSVSDVAERRRGKGRGPQEETYERFSWGKDEQKETSSDVDVAHVDRSAPVVDVKPNFELSGKLAKESNNVNGIQIKFTRPPEARPPEKKWVLIVFKGDSPDPIGAFPPPFSWLIQQTRFGCIDRHAFCLEESEKWPIMLYPLSL